MSENLYRHYMEVMNAMPDHRVLQVMESLHGNSALTISQLAVSVKLSSSHLQHLFKQQTGVSIKAYVIERRLQSAVNLLQTTYLSVKEVRNGVGIPDGSNFVRYFKRRFGRTPSHYRQDRSNAESTNE